MVSQDTPDRIAASIRRRTARAPSRCPATRGRPRDLAQRPLPSMMMATWAGRTPTDPATALAGGFWETPAGIRTPGAMTPGVTRTEGWSYASMTRWVMTGIVCLDSLSLDLPYVFFLVRERFVHIFDELIGEFLHLLSPVLSQVLADLVLLFVALNLLHAVAADGAHRDLGAFRVFG